MRGLRHAAVSTSYAGPHTFHVLQADDFMLQAHGLLKVVSLCIGLQVSCNRSCWGKTVPRKCGTQLLWPRELWKLIKPPGLCMPQLLCHGKLVCL